MKSGFRPSFWSCWNIIRGFSFEESLRSKVSVLFEAQGTKARRQGEGTWVLRKSIAALEEVEI